MVLRKLMGIFTITLIIGAASLAMAGVPDVTQCSTSRAYQGAEYAVLRCLPNGGGEPFTAAVAQGGGTVDATISVIVRDGAGVPIVLYPFEDIWLESADGGLSACAGGATANFSTDALGYTEWAVPLQAGGWSFGSTFVVINGNQVPQALAVGFNSADLDGSGAVNLSDVQAFASDYYSGGYVFRSDLLFDSLVNLSDIPKMASGYGAECP
jgi:hypothetical protein